MSVDYSKLRSVTAREVIRALRKDGFELEKQRPGAHQQYRHPEDKRRVTVSFHSPSDTLRVKTLKSMVEQQAKWTEEDLKRLEMLI